MTGELQVGEHVKKAEGAIAVARLERAANVLARAAHPGVIELISYTPTGLESAELRTVRVDAPTLADRAVAPKELAGIVAAVATTLADLHARQMAHGAIDSHHILVPTGAAPRLCGFSGDPAANPSDDVVGLGRLLQLDRLDDHDRSGALEVLRSGRGTRVPRWRRTTQLTGAAPARPEDVRRTLHEIARLAMDDDPARQPSARAVATLLHDRVPDAQLPAARGGPEGPIAGRGAVLRTIGQRLSVVVGLVTLLGLAVLVIGALIPRPSLELEHEQLPVASTTTVETAVRVWPDDVCDPVPTPLQGDVDADGCDDPVVFADGVLISESVRLAVGSPDDLVATGDWHCDGRNTLVLLRAGAASVWHFPTWPDPGDTVVGILVADGVDGVTIASRRGEADCDRLDVGLADGGTVTLDVPSVEVDA